MNLAENMTVGSNRLQNSSKKSVFSTGVNWNQNNSNSNSNIFGGGGNFWEGNHNSSTEIFQNQKSQVLGQGIFSNANQQTGLSNNIFSSTEVLNNHKPSNINTLSTPTKNHNQNSSIFGGNGIFSSLVGVSNQQNKNTNNLVSNGIFGQQGVQNGSQNQNLNGGMVCNQEFQRNQNISGTFYIPFKTTQLVEKKDNNTQDFSRFACITAMSEYNNKSLEELRNEDIVLKRSGQTVNRQNERKATGQIYNHGQKDVVGGLCQNQGLNSFFNSGSTLFNQNNTQNQILNSGSTHTGIQCLGLLQTIEKKDQNQIKLTNNTFSVVPQKQNQITNNSALINRSKNIIQSLEGNFKGTTTEQNQIKGLFNVGTAPSIGATTQSGSTSQMLVGAGYVNKQQGNILFNNAEPQTQNQLIHTNGGFFGSLGISNEQNQNSLVGGGLLSGRQTNHNQIGQKISQQGEEVKPTGSLFGGLTCLSGQTGQISTEQNPNPISRGEGFIFGSPITQPTGIHPVSQPKISIVAPTNILGVNLESVSEGVRNAIFNEKSVKDFIRQIEEEFDFTDDYLNYSRKKTMRPYDYYLEQQGPTILSNEFYRSSFKSRQNLPKETNFKDLKNFINLSYSNPKKKFNIQDKFLQNKRKAASYLSTNERDFNRNIIEINKKSRLDSPYEKKQKFEFNYKIDKDEKDENYSDNFDINYNATSIRSSGNTNISIDNFKETFINKFDREEKIIQFLITIKDQNIEFRLAANKNNSISLLKELILEKLNNVNKSKYKLVSVENLILMKKNRFMIDNKKISDYEIKYEDKIVVIVDHQNKEEEEKDEQVSQTEKRCVNDKMVLKEKIKNKYSVNLNEITPLGMLPILSKTTYKTQPGINFLARMTLNELKNVEKFSVYNDYGKVQWKNSVNLCELDLDDIIDIGERVIRIYRGKTPRPPIGIGLNKPAILTLHNILPAEEVKTDEEKDEFIEKLKIICVEQHGKFINYDFISNDLTFSVDNFNF